MFLLTCSHQAIKLIVFFNWFYFEHPINVHVRLLQMLPGDVRVARGSGTRRGSADCKNMSSECGQSLSAKVSVDEVQMCSHNHHCRVWCSGLFIKNKEYNLKWFTGKLIQKKTAFYSQGINTKTTIITKKALEHNVTFVFVGFHLHLFKKTQFISSSNSGIMFKTKICY